VDKQNNIEKKVRYVAVFIFLFTTFSGAIRKWGIDSSLINNIILAVQLCIAFFFLFLLKNKNVRSPFKPLLIAYIALLILLGFNPMNLTVFHSIFGIIIHLGMWLAFFFYFENRDLFDFKSSYKLFIAICFVELILGFVQYTLPPTHILNKYVNETALTDIATIGNSVRVTGTFSYLAGFGSFFIFYSLLLWSLAKSGYSSIKIIFLYSFGMIGCFMSGSRSALYPYLFIGMLIFYTEYGVKKLFGVITSTSLIILFTIGITYFLGERVTFVSNVINKSYENFETRRTINKDRGEERGRILKTLDGVIFFKGDYPEIGVGLGATYQGVTAVWGTSPYVINYPGFLEEEPERIVVEGGFVLFFFRLILFIYLFNKLSIPKVPKAFFLGFSFIFLSLVFFTYSATYFFLGLMLLDSAYRSTKKQLETANQPLHE